MAKSKNFYDKLDFVDDKVKVKYAERYLCGFLLIRWKKKGYHNII